MKQLTALAILILSLAILTACAPSPAAAPTQAPPPTQPPSPTPPPPPPTATQPPKDLLATIKERGRMVMSTDPNYAPQSFLDDKGEMVGFDIDVGKEVARRLGVELEFTTPDWDLITAGNWGGRWDISIGSMTITPERAKVLHFTQPYYYTPAQFVVHTDNTDIKTVGDLSGKRIGVCGACTYEFYLDKTLVIEGEEFEFQVDNAEIHTYDTDADAIQDLALGDGVRLDAVLSALPTLVEAQKQGVPIKLVGDPVFYEPLAVAIDRAAPQDPTSFVEAVDKIIGEMHADGTLTQLSMKWYGVDLTKKAEAKAMIPPPDVETVSAIVAKGGCGGCHTIPGIQGAAGTLGPEWCSVTKAYQEGRVDQAYIRQSIVDPNAVIREGFPANIMPQNFGDTLTSEEIDTLVAFIATLKCE